MHDYNIVLCRSICPIGQWITAILGLKGELGSLVTDPTALGSSSAFEEDRNLGLHQSYFGCLLSMAQNAWEGNLVAITSLGE